MRSQTPEALSAEGAFQIQLPICGINFSINISIPQVKVNMRETEFYTTFTTF